MVSSISQEWFLFSKLVRRNDTNGLPLWQVKWEKELEMGAGMLFSKIKCFKDECFETNRCSVVDYLCTRNLIC